RRFCANQARQSAELASSLARVYKKPASRTLSLLAVLLCKDPRTRWVDLFPYEISTRLVDPLWNLGLNLAVHKNRSLRSPAVNLRRYSVLHRQPHSSCDHSVSSYPVAIESKRLGALGADWSPLFRYQLWVCLLGGAVHLLGS